MDKVAIFIITILSIAVLSMGYVIYLQRKKYKKLEKDLSFYVNHQDDDLLGKAKFSELGLMSAGIAHEINNPISIINARSTQLMRLCKKKGSHDEILKGLEQILYTSERIARTVRGIRDFIYQDSQQYEDEISLKEIFDNVLVFCSQRLKNHGIELRLFNIHEIRLSGHRVQFEQAFLNMINNSLDAIDNLPEKWIEITAFEGSDTVQIYFKDSGHGIPDDIADEMMKPFFTTKKSKGTGLGLALVRGIAEGHQGTLMYIKNAENTTFMLELPKMKRFSIERQVHARPDVGHDINTQLSF